jgi:hypothetical protein
VVVWDNPNTYVASGLKRYEAEHDWFSSASGRYAPDLNPVEGIWSRLRRAMVNSAFGTLDDLDRTLRRELRRVQIRLHFVDGCLTTAALPSHHRAHPETSIITMSVAEGHDAGNDGRGSPANHSCIAAQTPAVRLRGIGDRVA